MTTLINKYEKLQINSHRHRNTETKHKLRIGKGSETTARQCDEVNCAFDWLLFSANTVMLVSFAIVKLSCEF